MTDQEVNYEANVARGAALLDDARPGWWKTINLDILDQATTSVCVLGQVFGRYEVGKDELGIDATQAKNLGYSGYAEQFATYTQAWKNLINARRANDVTAAHAVVTDIDAFAEVVRKYVAEAIEIGRAGTDGDHTDSGITFRCLAALGVLGPGLEHLS